MSSSKARVAALKAKDALRGTDPFLRAAERSGQDHEAAEYQSALKESARKTANEDADRVGGTAEVDAIVTLTRRIIVQLGSDSRQSANNGVLESLSKRARIMVERFPLAHNSEGSAPGSTNACSARGPGGGDEHSNVCGTACSHSHDRNHAGSAAESALGTGPNSNWRRTLAVAAVSIEMEIRYGVALEAYRNGSMASCILLCRDLLLLCVPSRLLSTFPVTLRTWVLRARAWAAVAAGTGGGLGVSPASAAGPLLVCNLHFDKVLRLLGHSPPAATDTALHSALGEGEMGTGAREPEPKTVGGLEQDCAIFPVGAVAALTDRGAALKHVLGLKTVTVRTINGINEGRKGKESPVDDVEELSRRAAVLLEEGCARSAVSMATIVLNRLQALAVDGAHVSTPPDVPTPLLMRVLHLLVIAVASRAGGGPQWVGGDVNEHAAPFLEAAPVGADDGTLPPPVMAQHGHGRMGPLPLPLPARVRLVQCAAYAWTAVAVAGQGEEETARRIRCVAHSLIGESLLDIGRDGCGESWVYEELQGMKGVRHLGVAALLVSVAEERQRSPAVDVSALLRTARFHLEQASAAGSAGWVHAQPPEEGGGGQYSRAQDSTTMLLLHVVETGARIADATLRPMLLRRLDSALTKWA